MKNILIIISVLLISKFGLAVDNDNQITMGTWRLVNYISDVANSSQEFISFQQRHPQYFDGYNADEVTSANISISIYEYDGLTTCGPNDPRLSIKNVSYGVCLKADQTHGQHCFQSATSLPAPYDPCRP